MPSFVSSKCKSSVFLFAPPRILKLRHSLALVTQGQGAPGQGGEGCSVAPPRPGCHTWAGRTSVCQSWQGQAGHEIAEGALLNAHDARRGNARGLCGDAAAGEDLPRELPWEPSPRFRGPKLRLLVLLLMSSLRLCGWEWERALGAVRAGEPLHLAPVLLNKAAPSSGTGQGVYLYGTSYGSIL